MVQDAVILTKRTRRLRRRLSTVFRFAWAAAIPTLISALAAADDLANLPSDSLNNEREICRYIHSDSSHHGSHKPVCGPESEIKIERPAKGLMTYEVNRFPDSKPTAEQQKAADDLVEKCIASAKSHGWLNFQQGKADGYQPLPGDPVHYLKLDFIDDEHVLDPDRPEYLMYYGWGENKKLLAMMFMVNGLEMEGPQVGGPLTRWHFHTWAEPWCLNEGRTTLAPAPIDGKCEDGTPSYRGAEMMHVWLLDHPDGRFAHNMAMGLKLTKKLVAERGF